MRASDRLIIAELVAVFLATFTLMPLTSDNDFLASSWVLLVLLAGVTFGLRRFRLGAGLVFSVQLLLLIAYLLLLATAAPASAGGLPTRYLYLWLSGIEHIQTQAAPMEPNEGITVIFISVIGVVWILTDLLVSGLGRPIWGLAPPLTLFLVPAIGLGTDSGVLSFACIAVGYLGILLAQGLNTTARWSRGLSRDTGGTGSSSPVVWRSAALIGTPAVIATVVLGLALPTLSLPGFGFGSGAGGSGRLQLTDPTLDLRRNLNQPADTVVLQYQTNRPGGTYLRMASLPELNSSGWHNIPMQLNSGGDLPAIPGLSGEPGQRRVTSIRVLDFRSEYLPMPYAPRSFSAPGEWAYDPNSLVVLAGAGRGRTDAIRNLTYSVDSVDIAPAPADLATAVAGSPVDDTITNVLPDGFPESIVSLTNRVTNGADTPVKQAAAIQAFLRSDRFTYSTEPLPGSGFRALENFLVEDRRGYCEQFAAAMAAMARVVNIPSRVAVGFLPGERRTDTYEVSIRDMHAWPELYFAGFGWVRFEPTPSSVTGTAPNWTLPTRDDPTDEPSQAPSAQPSAAQPTTPDDQSAAPTTAPVDVSAGSGSGWVQTLLIGLGALGLLALLAAPATIRVRRRVGRLQVEGDASDQVESVWAEIRDTVVDHGGAWPSGSSPRVIGSEVARGLEQPESENMGQIATLVERSRYARSVDAEAVHRDLPTMTHDIRHGIAAPRSALRRALAVVFPRSVFPTWLRRPFSRRR